MYSEVRLLTFCVTFQASHDVCTDQRAMTRHIYVYALVKEAGFTSRSSFCLDVYFIYTSIILVLNELLLYRKKFI